MKQTLYLLALASFALIVSCETCTLVKNQPQWIEQGPYYLTDTAVEGIPGEPSAGAINCILPHPTNKEILYVGTVNGGVWKTENAYDGSPHWKPLTDHLPSLSISDMVFDPLDSTYQTIYAATGKLSSGARRGGPELGIYVTSDGGENWRITGAIDLKGKTIYKILALPTNTFNPKIPYLFAATDAGVYRSHSVDTFHRALNGIAVDLTYDESDPTQLFAALRGKGIYHSDNSGTTVSWDSLEIPGMDLSNQTNLKLGMVDKRLYVAEARDDESKVRLFTAPPPYDKFISLNTPSTIEGAIAGIGGEQLGPFPGDQSSIHFSFLAQGTENNPVLYIGGDRNKRMNSLLFSSTGQGKSSGRIFRGTPGNNGIYWLPIVGAATNNTAPHADSRHLVFDAAGHLLEADDGGIYRLTGSEPAWRWESLNGDLRITELYSVAWDNRTQSIVAGAQDVGSLEQVTPALSGDSVKRWKAARLYSLLGQDLGDLIAQSSNLESDGGIVAVSNQDSFSIRYGMGNGFQTFVSRQYWYEIDPINVVSRFYLFDYGCLGMFCALHPADTINTSGFHLIRYEINRADPTRFVIGARGIYDFRYDGATMETIDTFRLRRNAAALAYGAPGNPDILYVAKSNEISLSPDAGTSWLRKVYEDTTLRPRDKDIQDLAIDPKEPRNVYFITRNRVFRYNDFASGSASIDTLTGNLPDVLDGYGLNLKTLVAFNVDVKGEEKTILLTGGYGGVFYCLPGEDGQPGRFWIKYGTGMPNVIVMDLHYNAKDDVLVAGTFGRGAWIVPEVSVSLPELSVR